MYWVYCTTFEQWKHRLPSYSQKAFFFHSISSECGAANNTSSSPYLISSCGCVWRRRRSRSRSGSHGRRRRSHSRSRRRSRSRERDRNRHKGRDRDRDRDRERERDRDRGRDRDKDKDKSKDKTDKKGWVKNKFVSYAQKKATIKSHYQWGPFQSTAMQSLVPMALTAHVSPHPSVHHCLSTFIFPVIKHRPLYHGRIPFLQKNKSWRYVQMENSSAPEVRLLEDVFFWQDVLIFLAPACNKPQDLTASCASLVCSYMHLK